MNRIAQVFFALCKNIDTPISLSRWLMFKNGEFEQLARSRIKPEWYNEASRFQDDYLVDSYLRKYESLPTGLDLEAEALQSFNEAEAHCRETNGRFRRSDPALTQGDVGRILHAARRKLAYLFAGFSHENTYMDSRTGPGATFSLKGLDATVDNKVLSTEVTYRAIPYARFLFEDPTRFLAVTGVLPEGPFCVLPSLFNVVKGNRVATVPKSSTTDRTIAIEPSVNIELQLSVGSFIRRRLRAVAGIDLDSQVFNQRAARDALRLGLATVDLKSASDTVSLEVVYDLLPVDVALILDDLRSPHYLLKGKWCKSEKFSSMGNGFTFELETALFWAISSSIGEAGNWCLVYGDDIILPSCYFDQLSIVLKAVGFIINSEKSYHEGNFYESCGKHYFGGIDVTPLYQKEDLPDKPSVAGLPAIYRAANRLRRYALRSGCGWCCDRRFLAPWAATFRGIEVKHFIPLVDASGALYEGDEGLAVDRDTILSKAVAWGLGSVKLRVLRFRATRVVRVNHAALLAHSLRLRAPAFLSEAGVYRRRGQYVERRAWFRLGVGDAAWC